MMIICVNLLNLRINIRYSGRSGEKRFLTAKTPPAKSGTQDMAKNAKKFEHEGTEKGITNADVSRRFILHSSAKAERRRKS